MKKSQKKHQFLIFIKLLVKKVLESIENQRTNGG